MTGWPGGGKTLPTLSLRYNISCQGSLERLINRVCFAIFYMIMLVFCSCMPMQGIM